MSGKYYRYVIPGPAVAQGRPRLTTIGGHPRAYDPKKSRDYKAYIQLCVKEQGAPEEPLTGEISLLIVEYRAIPQSWSKRKHEEALLGDITPTTRPDWDNVGKAVCDALNGLVWKDDAQIVRAEVRKNYDDEPRVAIEVEAL